MPETFEDIKGRLDEITQAVKDPDIPLDDALELYEEAVKLAARLSEAISVDPQSLQEQGQGEDQGASAQAEAASAQAEAAGAQAEAAASADSQPGDPA